MPNIKPLNRLVTKAAGSANAFPMLNLIVPGLLHTLDDHEEPPERNPFK